MEQKLIIASLLQKFKFELISPDYKVPEEFLNVYSPGKNFKLVFVKRQ